MGGEQLRKEKKRGKNSRKGDKLKWGECAGYGYPSNFHYRHPGGGANWGGEFVRQKEGPGPNKKGEKVTTYQVRDEHNLKFRLGQSKKEKDKGRSTPWGPPWGKLPAYRTKNWGTPCFNREGVTWPQGARDKAAYPRKKKCGGFLTPDIKSGKQKKVSWP